MGNSDRYREQLCGSQREDGDEWNSWERLRGTNFQLQSHK